MSAVPNRAQFLATYEGLPDSGVQVGDVSTVMRYASDAKFRAAMDAEAQHNRDMANAFFDRHRDKALIALGYIDAQGGEA